MFKTHAPNSLITQSTWIAYLLGFTCNRSSPTEPASENGSKSERARCKNASETLRDYITFAFAVRISHQQCIDWTIGEWILSVSLREEVNWLNYWKWRVKLSENWDKYGTLEYPHKVTTSSLLFFFFCLEGFKISSLIKIPYMSYMAWNI